MGIVRQADIDRKMKPFNEKAKFFIDTLIEAGSYFINNNEVSYISASVRRQLSQYLRHKQELHKVYITKELESKPYTRADRPDLRRKRRQNVRS